MTPSAMTAAGRSAASRSATRRTAPAPGHRRHLRQRPAPHAPRRVSGPLVRGARTAPAPRHSGTLGMRALAVVRSLPEHSVIDRLVRGRAWIPVLGVLLAGIVAMQVEVLKLGTNMGRLVQRSTVLQSQNESLQASVAALGGDQRIERMATGMGMVMPEPTTIAFLRAAGGDASRALANIHTPDPTTFASTLAAQTAAAAAASAAQSASASSNSSTSSAPTTSSASSAPSAPATPATSGATATSGAPATSGPTAPAATQGSAAPAPTQGSPSGAAGSGSAPPGPSTGAASVAPSSSQSSSPAGG